MTQDALEARRESLSELENSEREAKRLEEALERGRLHSTAPSVPDTESDTDAADNTDTTTSTGQDGNEQDENPASVFLPPHPGPSPVRRRAPGMGLLNALSYTIHGMMDTDPESARRSGISKTRETISQVAAIWLPLLSMAKRLFSSLRTPFIFRPRISSMPALLSKPTWIVSSGKRLRICVRCRSVWPVATGSGARRCAQPFF